MMYIVFVLLAFCDETGSVSYNALRILIYAYMEKIEKQGDVEEL